MTRLIALPAITLLLMACQPEETASEDICGVKGFATLVGTAASDHDFTDPNRPHRIIPPNSAVTMDYRPDRLNVDLDQAGQITRFWCG